MALLDKILKNYNTLSRIPALLNAEITCNGTVINSIWTQRDLDKGKTTKITRVHSLDSDLKKAKSIFSVDTTNQSLICLSKSENLIGLIREGDSKQFLEIWTQDELKTTVDLKSLDVHGDVYTDGEFASLEFSPDETKLLYVAEKKPPKTEPFFKRKQAKSDDTKPEDIAKGQEYLYREDWGEQLVGKIQSVLVQYDLVKDQVEILSGIPDDVCPAKPTYSNDGSYLIGIAYKTEPRKLGLIYCTNRPSTIFKVDFEGNYTEINLENKSVKNPKFTPDGRGIIWLQRDAGGPHAACMSLVKTAAPITEASKIDVIVDIVQTEITTKNGKSFYGLYNSGFPRRCWTNDGRLVLSTNQKNNIQSYLIDINNKSITQLGDFDDSFIALNVVDDIVLVNRRNFLKPDTLIVGKLKSDVEYMEWIEVTPRDRIPTLENHAYHYLDLVQDNDLVKNFTAIYLGPETGSEASIPLVVWPHGGPHSAFANNLSLEASLFLKLGYAILLVNYRGSLGFGQASVDFLPGRVGISDVSDCILATETALAKYPWLNRNTIALVGGSHGGFLVTHLSGQHPDLFKVVVARNPVIDIASMSVMSDIPDWCYVEAGSDYNQAGEPSVDILKTMRLQSPIQHAHKVKAPTMLQVGSKDLRVPPHQSKEYYTRLKANGVTVKVHLYDDNHPLGGVLNEADNLVNTILFIEEHTKG